MEGQRTSETSAEPTPRTRWTQRENPWSKILCVLGVLGVESTRRTSLMRVLNTAQMREADRRTIEDIGIPSLVLMENAGRQAVAAMEAIYGDLLERQVAVLCGRGN